MAFCRLEDTFHNDAKWRRIASLLGIDRVTAAGHVAFLYSWAAQHARDGDLRDFDSVDLEDAMGWQGDAGALVEALISERVGILEQGDHGLFIHAYMEKAETHRAAVRKRAQRMREKENPTNSTKMSQDMPVTVTTPIVGQSFSVSRLERERENEREEREREQPQPTANERAQAENALSTYSIPADLAVTLIDHWQDERQARGKSKILVSAPAWISDARAILLACRGDMDLAKRVVTAYVKSDHPYWASRWWQLSILAMPQDFARALDLIDNPGKAPSSPQGGRKRMTAAETKAKLHATLYGAPNASEGDAL